MDDWRQQSLAGINTSADTKGEDSNVLLLDVRLNNADDDSTNARPASFRGV